MIDNANQTINYLPKLKNSYYAMRHGQSMANSEGLIVSQPAYGVNGYGLNETGRQQVKSSLALCTLDTSTRIICSDFKRARETAKLAHQMLGCTHYFEINRQLRERNFGILELGPDHRYAEVWAADKSGLALPDDVETVAFVIKRAVDVILNLENRFCGINCLLIAHGDILQILQTAFFQIPANCHRDLPHLETAEIRLLND